MTRLPRPSIRLWLPLAIFALTILWSVQHLYSLRNTLSYATRPLWDSNKGDPHRFIPHLYADGLPADDQAACARHGWSQRTRAGGAEKVKLIDAVIFSTELDLLEIRMRELWDVVDTFVVLESAHTFTGLPKNLTFSENRARFAPYESKLSYAQTAGRTLAAGEGPFAIEIEMRNAVTEWIRTSVHPSHGDLLLMSDVDEIPAAHTLSLLKSCAAPLPLHLQLRNYVYSFEFPTDMASWRAQLHEWSAELGGTSYRHGKSSNDVLADAGWHCSFCFRNLSDFSFKMAAYSHADRLFGNANWQSFLDPKRIQRLVCEGKDLFDMLPEVYTWAELLQRWNGASRTSSAVHLPRAVIEDPIKYRFLLPGGCTREA